MIGRYSDLIEAAPKDEEVYDIEDEYNRKEIDYSYYRSAVKQKEDALFSLVKKNSWMTMDRVWIFSGIFAILSFFYYFDILILTPIGLFIFISFIYRYIFRSAQLFKAEMRNNVNKLNSDYAGLATELKEELDGVKSELFVIKAGIKILEQDIKHLKQDVGQLPRTFVFSVLDAHKKRLEDLESRIDSHNVKN